MDTQLIENTIINLSNLHGISGFETDVAKEIRKLFEPYVDEVTIDALGSVIAHKKSKNPNAKKNYA